MNRFIISLLAIFAMVAQAIAAELSLPAIFASEMVLQQNTAAPIWGTAEPNAKLIISPSWAKKSITTTADNNGCWRTSINTPSASLSDFSITISDKKSTIVLDHILIGEVWLCSGQSNMEMPMQGYPNQIIENGASDILHSSNPYIRCFTVARNSTTTPATSVEGSWLSANPANTGLFTATGYYFARLLYQTLNIPIGLLTSSWSGSMIEAWIPEKALKDFPAKHNSIPKTDADIKRQNWDPTVLYNGMIHPIQTFAIRGAIWYQGEQNREEPALYPELFHNMVTAWRELWQQGDFPFYYCQIAPYKYNGGTNSAYIREAQAKCMTRTPNTGMAVLMDANSPYCIHPPKKFQAGERLARWALAQTYNLKNTPHRSPEFQSLEVQDSIATISFAHTGSSNLTSFGQPIKNFTIAGSDKIFHPATATLHGTKIKLYSPNVKQPVAVRYCFDDTSASEVFSVDSHLPLSSFRTDNW